MSVDELLLRKKVEAKARQRALRRLAVIHADEFEELFEKELDRAVRQEALTTQDDGDVTPEQEESWQQGYRLIGQPYPEQYDGTDRG